MQVSHVDNDIVEQSPTIPQSISKEYLIHPLGLTLSTPVQSYLKILLIQQEDDYTCPLCCITIKYILGITLVIFFLIIPSFMIYIGVRYKFCEDIFSVWLLAGLYEFLYYWQETICQRLLGYESCKEVTLARKYDYIQGVPQKTGILV